MPSADMRRKLCDKCGGAKLKMRYRLWGPAKAGTTCGVYWGRRSAGFQTCCIADFQIGMPFAKPLACRFRNLRHSRLGSLRYLEINAVRKLTNNEDRKFKPGFGYRSERVVREHGRPRFADGRWCPSETRRARRPAAVRRDQKRGSRC